uniref:Uncharacterized protein n=1 Tax=Caenorhabditis japonica TaxID=281687 RepID=A0A8R1IHU5_CAEJA
MPNEHKRKMTEEQSSFPSFSPYPRIPPGELFFSALLLSSWHCRRLLVFSVVVVISQDLSVTTASSRREKSSSPPSGDVSCKRSGNSASLTSSPFRYPSVKK